MFAASKTDSVSGGYQISRSLRFNSADSAYLNRTPASASNRTTWTWSGWVKRSSLGAYNFLFNAVSGNSETEIIFTNNDTLQFLVYNSGATAGSLNTTQVFRDVSAWYHIVVAYDSTNATSGERMRMYVNGSRVTAFSGETYPAQNTQGLINSTISHTLGAYTPTQFFVNGYMTEVNFIDGQALTPSSFGETNAQTGVWQPKAYSSTYGTNGFYLNFSDNSNTTAATLGKDYSGNGNNWTPNNFSVTAGAGNDSLVDSPTAYGTDTGVGGTVRGNYCTLNPLASSVATPSNGNLDLTTSTTGNKTTFSTIGMSSGKWYWEMLMNSSQEVLVGIANSSAPLTDYLGQGVNGWSYDTSNGQKYTNNVGSSYGASSTTNDVIGVAFDADAGTLVFYKNGTSQGTAFSSLASNTYFPACTVYASGGSVSFNFGQRPFAYTAPSGYKALCTQNLPTPTIGATTATQAGKYFNAVTYAGNGGTQSVTGVGFQPDFVWVKNRSAANGHGFEDVLRGAGYTLASDSTSAEINYSNYFTAFTSDGFNMALGGGTFNNSSSNYVAWNWKANGSGSTNTAGSITSTVSANTTSGFSVVTFTGVTGGGTVGHGLGVAPSMIIVKSRNNVVGWVTYHASLGADKYLLLNTTDSVYTNTSTWKNTSPTSTVFSVGDNAFPNTWTEVAYCFAPVSGFSAMGSWTGNGSTDGPFLYCGFRPAYILMKRTDSATNGDWGVVDNMRSPYNVAQLILSPNSSAAEFNFAPYGQFVDILSNGFKVRTNDVGTNANGSTYIYMAFASNPFKFSLGR